MIAVVLYAACVTAAIGLGFLLGRADRDATRATTPTPNVTAYLPQEWTA